MKSCWANPMLALLVLASGLVLVASPATGLPISDFQVNGAGIANFTCQLGSLSPNCLSNSGGEVTGAVSGTYTLALTTGPAGAPQSNGGLCFPANGALQIVDATTGDVLNFKTVGLMCEEVFPSSSYHYDGTYRIDSPANSGTGQFATAAGGGSLTATFEKGFDGATFIKVDGTVRF